MADNVMISSNATPKLEINETINNVAYSHNIVNDLLGTIGGNMSYQYNPAQSVAYRNVVLKNTTEDVDWTDATDYLDVSSDDPYGAGNNSLSGIATIHGIGVKVKGAIGTASNCNIYIQTESATAGVAIANLGVGESVFIPLQAGIHKADLDIRANSYTDGTNELTIDLVVLGE